MSYGIGSITLMRFRIVSFVVVLFLGLGLLLDITAVVLMVQGAQKHLLTFHAFLGSSAFVLMFINAVLAFRHYLQKGSSTWVSKGYLLYAKFAYLIWVSAYFIGFLTVIFR